MRKLILAFVFAAPIVLAQTSERQVRYSTSSFALTPPSDRAPEDIAFGYLMSAGGIAPDNSGSVYLAKEYKTEHNGVTHIVYRQRFQGIEVSNAAWVVNIGDDGAVLNSGGNLYTAPPALNFSDQLAADVAVQAAVREVNPRIAEKYTPLEIAGDRRGDGTSRRNDRRRVQFAAGDLGDTVEGKMVWYAHRGTLLLAWVFNVVDEDGVSAYDVAVEAETGAVIDKRETTFFQAPKKGFVFDKGFPQPNPRPGVRLTSAPPAVERSLMTLTGDPVASPQGWMLNNETAGYNAVVGENLLGQTFLANATRTSATGDFTFPLLLGPTSPNPLTYRDSANTNLFYWVNRVHDMHYALGFNEAAGNFQSDNYGRGGVGGDPMLAYSHFGAAAQGAASLNNAFFTYRSLEDGSPSMIAMYATMTGAAGFYADGAYAADVIAHEYTHGVSLRLLPNGYGSFQTGAMGEAWSDFFGLEFSTPEGGVVDGSYPTGEYWIQSWGTGIRTRPFSTNVTINPLTYANLGHVTYAGAEVHADGEIWVEALWEARGNLIQQFGETEGRRRMRQLVIDGLKLSPPSPSMVDARDAILLADRVDFKGASQSPLWTAFAKRGLGALAHSDGGDTTHVISSFEVPTSRAKLKFYEDTFVPGEPIRVLLSDADLNQPTVRVQLSTTSGDVEDLILRRTGSVYFEGIFSSSNVVTPQNGTLNIVPGDTITATYIDANAGSFGPFNLGTTAVTATAAMQLPYTLVTTTTPPTALNPFPNETRLTNVRAPATATLPFDFPFFTKKYRSMIVFPTGIIAFEPSVFTSLFRPGCNDTTELNRIGGIAPLFANLTFGTAQPNEGVFISTSGANTVNIRWAAETLPSAPSIGASIPEPVNMAVTMTAEGAITFMYGTGNANLHTAVQTLSTCGSQPTVGISPGHDVYSRTLTLRTYTLAPTFTLYPPFNATTTPEVILERPAANDTVTGVMRVSGVAYEPGATNSANLTFLNRRDILIDGVQRGVTTTIVSRPDYCATNNVAGCPTVGYQADLNLASLGLSSGRHTIFVRASNTRGAFKDTAPVAFTIADGTSRVPKGAIESPASGDELSGTVTVRGHAYADDLIVTRVDLLVDGITMSGTGYGIARNDICGTLTTPLPPNCPNVGWTLSLNTRSGSPPLPDGAHSMQLRVLDQLGRFTMLPDKPVPFTVKNGPQTFPAGAVTSVKPGDRLSGVVSVSGYAYSPGGRILAAFIVIDGTALTSGTYGLPRPDDCATLPTVTACPNIGFNINFDTRTIPNGNHVLGVFLVNDAGLSIVIPNLDRNGMNVVVDNR